MNTDTLGVRPPSETYREQNASPDVKPKRFPVKAIIGSILALLLVVSAIAATKASQIMAMIEAGESFVPPPVGVTTVEAVATQWEATTTATGTAVANQEVMIASEVPGKVLSLRFASGDVVERGEVLVTLDAAVDRASLSSARAEAELADTDLNRTERLVQNSALAQADLDAARARRSQARAAARGLRAAIGKRTIRAPFAGRLGIREVDIGEIVDAGQPIVSLQNLDPVYVDFRVPDTSAGRIAVGHTIRVQSNALGSALEGRVEVIDPRIDPATRNVRIRASVPNPGEQIRSGMFLDVEAIEPQLLDVVVIPNTAVLYAPYGNSVYVVNEQDDGLVAEQLFVRLGERRGDLVAIASGLEAGQTVVSTGAFKLQNGMAVVLQNDVAPAPAEAEPQPEDQ
ncbi:MAG: efflux RND transporter periplasmic adaptor subunit [Myxococcota bacterium]